MQESVFASLICIIDDRVPLAFRLDQMGVLFCLINQKIKTLSSLHCSGRLPKMWSRSQPYGWERGSLAGHTFFMFGGVHIINLAARAVGSTTFPLRTRRPTQ